MKLLSHDEWVREHIYKNEWRRKPHYLINCSRLKQSRLWPGSLEEFLFEKGKGVTIEDALEHITKLARCDDRTSEETEYLELLRDAIEKWPEAE